MLYAAIGAAALLLAVVLIAASVLSRDGDSSSPSAAVVDGSGTAQRGPTAQRFISKRVLSAKIRTS
jgi:hypothetical protein